MSSTTFRYQSDGLTPPRDTAEDLGRKNHPQALREEEEEEEGDHGEKRADHGLAVAVSLSKILRLSILLSIGRTDEAYSIRLRSVNLNV